MLDTIDNKLIQLLGKNAKKSSSEIAKELSISATTVRRRLKKLKESHKIRLVAVADPEKFGFHIATMIGLSVVPEKKDAALNYLVNVDNVRYLMETTGRYNIIIYARFHSTEELSQFLESTLNRIKGLNNVGTMIYLRSLKLHFMQVDNLNNF
jgi:Lrp/AsnC family transcriptional regulator for asnA, asnC and gidA